MTAGLRDGLAWDLVGLGLALRCAFHPSPGDRVAAFVDGDRLACPTTPDKHYSDPQAAFHMRAPLANRLG